MIFDLGMLVRLPERNDLEDLDTQTLREISQLQDAIRKVRAERN